MNAYKNSLVEFVRNKKRQSIGVVVALGKNSVGWSLCCPKDEFDKEKALKIAFARASVGSVVPLPNCIKPIFQKISERAIKYYKN